MDICFKINRYMKITLTMYPVLLSTEGCKDILSVTCADELTVIT